MLEANGNLWDLDGDVVVITTNGVVRRDGECVMGRGCARQARDNYPGLARRLGDYITEYGNRVFDLGTWDGKRIATFPVKHRWMDSAEVDLIERSAYQLVALTDKRGWKRVLIPRPGCGNGNLDWNDVRPVLAGILDDRFTAVTF